MGEATTPTGRVEQRDSKARNTVRIYHYKSNVLRVKKEKKITLRSCRINNKQDLALEVLLRITVSILLIKLIGPLPCCQESLTCRMRFPVCSSN